MAARKGQGEVEHERWTFAKSDAFDKIVWIQVSPQTGLSLQAASSFKKWP